MQIRHFYASQIQMITDGQTEVYNLEEKKKLLLHSCCGPCSTAVTERLIDRFDVTVYFYNPNITNEGEYIKRLNTQCEFLEKFNRGLPQDTQIKLREAAYDPEGFIHAVKGLENEPENGNRCTRCFMYRLERTAFEAFNNEFDMFASTLSVSPHKNTAVINDIGYELSNRTGIEFLDENFKKKDGFKRSTELSKEYNLYRQNFCGCIFSERPGAGAEDPSLERGNIT